jgi:hypothetical protein
MRGTPLRDGSTSNRPRVCGACVLAVAAICLGSVVAAPAADGCPNAQFRSGPSEDLPDCRAFEQVSPVEKGGLDAVSLNPLEHAQSSACEADEPCTFAYMNIGAALAGAPGNEFANAYLATRAAEGWQTTALTPPTPQAPANGFAKVSYAFSGDLSEAVLRVPLQQLAEGAPGGMYNLFLRRADGSYELVTASDPPQPPQAGCGRCFEQQDVPAFAGASSDFSHIIFEADDSLVEGAPGSGVENLYETADGRVSLVGRLPDGAIPAQGATAGGGINAVDEHTHELAHAISQNGSEVLFEAAADGGEPDPSQLGEMELYQRIDGSSTVEVSAPAPGAQPESCETQAAVCNPEPAEFWAASADGSVVYFTSKAALTRESYTGVEPAAGPEPRENPGNDLYRFHAGRLTDLTVDAANEAEDPDGADVLGVVGASEDGSYVYFVAEGKLATGASSASPNLYVWRETGAGTGALAFIATLAPPSREEEKDTTRTGENFEYHSDVADWIARPAESQAYVTPDGRHLAFMSVAPLTGYDNLDQTTGEADHEVFEYSAESGGLVCASCDANDASPLGSAFIGARSNERASTPFHQPRSLSDDGSRLFFSSPDPLVPGMEGGSMKLFEYESGAAHLISGAEGGGEAVFLDASASGNDIFFATREQLAPTDKDGLVDVYDARVDGGIAAPAEPMSCQGNACRESLTPAPSFSAPLSASFVGAGNITPPPSPPAKLTRRRLLSRALARCKRLKTKQRRSACAAVAERRYAPAAGRTRHAGVAKRRRPRG